MFDGELIDACVHHAWSNQLELMQYMGSGWTEFLGRPNLLPDGGGMISIAAGNSYRRPGGEKLAGTAPRPGAAEGSDYDLLKAQLLERLSVGTAILSFDAGAQAMALANPYVTAEIARAANDYTLSHWLNRGDRRLKALMLVPNQLAEHSVAEIRRVGAHPDIVGVLMGANGIGRAFGHPVYHPIYAAAAEAGLTIVIGAGTEVVPDSPSHTTAAGLPASYSEYRAMAAQPLMTHIASMITQGVFEKYPTLRVLVQGVGFMWIPALLWQFDSDWKAFRREVPWVRRLPSEYFYEHVRVTTNPFDTIPTERQLTLALECIERLDDVLCFASGYPNFDMEEPAKIASLLPETWHRKVFHDNAKALFERNRGNSQLDARQPVPVGEL